MIIPFYYGMGNPLNVELRLVDQGIAVRRVNHPAAENIVEMPVDVGIGFGNVFAAQKQPMM